YSVSPSGIFAAPDSPIQKPDDLAGVPVTVGYHSGSHYSTLQGLEQFLRREEIKLHFGGLLLDRLALLVDRQVPAASLCGAPPGTARYRSRAGGFQALLSARIAGALSCAGGCSTIRPRRAHRFRTVPAAGLRAHPPLDRVVESFSAGAEGRRRLCRVRGLGKFAVTRRRGASPTR